MINQLLNKKIFRFITAISTALLIILSSSLPSFSQTSGSTTTNSFPIPIEQLPVGSVGSNTIDIRSSSRVPTLVSQPAVRIKCNYSHMNYDDAIVFPNQPGATHLHLYFGNTKSNANSTHSSLSSLGNSTCSGGISDRSSYWIPAVLNAAGKPVVPNDNFIYYKSSGSSGFKDVPDGLKMIAGNSKAKGPERIFSYYWECRNASLGQLARAKYIPSCAPGNILRLQIIFPQCWDGFNLDSTNHQSHMSYLVKNSCPTSHPVRIPNISFVMNWNLTNESTDGWRLSSDMYDRTIPGGYSTHGDFFEAWRPEIRKIWMTNCLLAGKDCSVGLLGNGQQLFLKST